MYAVLAPLLLASLAHCFNPEVQEKYEKLSRDEFIEYFNNQHFSWKIKNNDYVTEEMMNTVEIGPSTVPVKEIQNEGNDEHMPVDFNAIERWPFCRSILTPSPPHGNCSAHWAMIAASLASDRCCISAVWPYEPLLSDTDLTCCKTCFSKNFCGAGKPEEALLFWLSEGLVSWGCKPDLPVGEACVRKCDQDIDYYLANKRFASRVYRVVEDDLEIRKEILNFGSVLATFAVYEDLKDYDGGIYVHTYGKLVGNHTVKITGFGESNGVPYWTALNTWGMDWGNNASFNIKRFQPDLGFEKNLLTATGRFVH